MKIHQKFLSEHTSGKCHLTLMFPIKLQKLFFSRKKYINNNLPINKKSGLLLDGKLLFFEHVNEKLKKMIKSINLL